MATPRTAGPIEGTRVVIGIYANPESHEIYVDREPFYIHKSEQEIVEWVCHQDHKGHVHGANCFTVEFKGKRGTPFERSTFHGHGALSGLATAKPNDKRLYKYRVIVPGVGTLDPQGGVKA